MSTSEENDEDKRKDIPFEEAMHIVDEGLYTNYVTAVAGLATLAAVASMQAMYLILPSVGCEMNLTSLERSFLGSVTFLGSILSSNIFGFMVDLYGRRKILLISTFGSTFASLLASLSPNAAVLTLSTFCTGIAVGGVFGIPYVYLSEFCSCRLRSKYISTASVLSLLANTYSPCMAWLVTWLDVNIQITDGFLFKSWRLYIILNTVPMFFSAIMLLYLPESPKFLLTTGKASEALDILSACYSVNTKKPKSNFPVGGLCLDAEDSGGSRVEGAGLRHFCLRLGVQVRELFRPPLLLYTAICSVLMFTNIGLFGVLQLWLPQQSSRLLEHRKLEGTSEATLCEVMARDFTTAASASCQVDSEIFQINILIGLTFFALSIIVLFLVQQIQVKSLLGTNLLLCGVVCSLVVFSKSLYLTLMSLGITVAILGASLSLIFSFIVDFYPTSLRASATTVSLFFGRLTVPVGGALLGAAFRSYCSAAYTAISTIFLVVGGMCFIIPSKESKPPSIE